MKKLIEDLRKKWDEEMLPFYPVIVVIFMITILWMGRYSVHVSPDYVYRMNRFTGEINMATPLYLAQKDKILYKTVEKYGFEPTHKVNK